MKYRILILLLGVSVLSGCVKIDIGEKTSPPTLGEEIRDLYRAREAGLISNEEYEGARKRLLDLW